VIDALVFDFDGLIIDTEWCEYRSICDQYERFGLHYSVEHFQQFVGSAWPVGWIDELRAGADVEIDPDEITASRRARRDELLALEGVLPGVVELLEAATALGLGLAVASSSSRAWVEPHLERLGLRRWFAAVLTRDDVGQAKPAPDLYLAAAAAIDADPVRAVAFEDSFNGCTAAKAAGLHCVVVPNRITAVQDFGHADLVVDSLIEIELHSLAQRIGSRPGLAGRPGS
jgi:HAD superfamily hydrolase (TIGR01509 family)